MFWNCLFTSNPILFSFKKDFLESIPCFQAAVGAMSDKHAASLCTSAWSFLPLFILLAMLHHNLLCHLENLLFYNVLITVPFLIILHFLAIGVSQRVSSCSTCAQPTALLPLPCAPPIGSIGRLLRKSWSPELERLENSCLKFEASSSLKN